MRRFQDRYYQQVGMLYGQARLGPGRRRLPRNEWKQEQAQVEALMNAKRQADVIAQEMEQKRADALLDVDTLTEAAREEITRQQRSAEQVRKEAEQILEHAKRERAAVQLKRAEADAVLAHTQSLMARAQKYDGPMGSLLGAVGVKDRLEQKVQSEVEAKILTMQAEIDRLKRTAGRVNAVTRERDGAKRALFELIRILCWPEQDLPPDGTYSPRNGHLNPIVEIVATHKEPATLLEALEAYVDQLRAHKLTLQAQDRQRLDLTPKASH